MNKKILIVDDEPNYAELIRLSLIQEGFETLEAYNGEKALELAKRDKPHLITVDILMPGMDGYQLIKLLKKDADTAAIPIIILSVVEEDKDKLKNEIVDYVIKPFSPKELIIKIKKCLDKYGLDNKNKQLGK